METETRTTTTPAIEPANTWDAAGGKPLALVLTTINDPHRIERVRVPVDLGDLQAIVQAAYDEHGLLAQPSYATEAAL